MQQYIVLATLHDGAYEAYGPFSYSRVELARERAESCGWVERASVVPITSPARFRSDWFHATSSRKDA